MELFLDEPRYRYRVFGFFTPAPAARKFRSAGIAMSLLIGGLGLLAAAVYVGGRRAVLPDGRVAAGVLRRQGALARAGAGALGAFASREFALL